MCVCVWHMGVYHIFFMYSCISGHSGYFYILAFVKNITNIGMHVSFHISVFTFFEKISEMELVDCVVVPFLPF